MAERNKNSRPKRDSIGSRKNDRASGKAQDRRLFSKSSDDKKTPPSFGKEKKAFDPKHDRRDKKTFYKKDKSFFRNEQKQISQNRSQSDEIRLNKYLSNSGICSRREADELIESGVVKVNGVVVTALGTKIKPTDTVIFGGQRISHEKKVYILLNKPKDYITTSKDPQDRKTVLHLIEHACKERVYPVGRLDRQTTGVLLLTNDGDLTRKLTHPSSNINKIYHVTLDQPFGRDDFHKLKQGVELEDGISKVDQSAYVEGADSRKEIGLEIHSGKNRVVRRLMEALGYKVVRLDRVSFAGLTKKGLTRGKFRFLNDQEVHFLKRL